LTFDSKDWLIGKYLYVKRSYEAEEIDRTTALLKKAGYLAEAGGGRALVLDVGANIGMICIAFLKNQYFERAWAFEPEPNSYRLLAHNVKQNGLGEQIRHFPYALSSAEGEVEMELSTDNSGDHRVRHRTTAGALREERRRTLKVQARTLDRFLAECPTLSRDDVALVWLDIQGHEGHFFQGAAGLLGHGVPVVSEFWPYAIERSGMSRADYLGIVSDLFTHFYFPQGGGFEKFPIAEIDHLFDAYSAPRQMCQMVLVRDR
jgi:FkbM family methyltransferase